MDTNYSITLSDAISHVGSLPRLLVKHPNAEAEIYLQGAHLTHWQPAGHEPVLFVSSRSPFAPAKPIRGGVPICFPWFANHATDPTKPAHGFARVRDWNLVESSKSADHAYIHLRLTSDLRTKAFWPFDFRADFKLTIGRTLEMKYIITNTDTKPFRYEEALHTYYRVSDVRNVTVSGLKGVTYLDKPNGMKRVVEEPEAIAFAGETDRVYINTPHTCVIHDPGMKRKITVEKSGSASTVIWNPFDKRAVNMPDLGEENWQPFVCVETANCFDNAITLGVGETHEIVSRISVNNA